MKRRPKGAGKPPGDPKLGTKVISADFWRSGMLANDKGAPKRCLANVMHVLSLHPAWAGVLAWDAFGLAVVTRKKPPMRPQDAPADYELGDWTDEDSARTAAWFASAAGFEPAIAQVDQALGAIARKSPVHPVKDYLAALVWDGTSRLDGFAAAYLGAPNSAYSAAVGSRWMIAAVARVFEPGCKVDSLLGLEGEQGIGKSSVLRLLAGVAWFADTGITIGEKDSYQALRRKWIFEFAELASIRGRDIERVKNFLSSQVDTFRASYGRRTQDHPRQVVFAGSTNESHYLADPTGSRRFWPVRCTQIDLTGIKRDRDQLWAEARVRYEKGEPWHLDTPELRALATDEQTEREERDDWIELVGRWLEKPTRSVGYGGNEFVRVHEGITTVDVLLGALGFAPERVNPGATKRVGHVLRSLGFTAVQRREGGQRVRRYFRTRDSTSDAAELANKPLSHVTGVTGEYAHIENNSSNGAQSISGKPPVPVVTCDSDDADEREAIQGEWKWRAE